MGVYRAAFARIEQTEALARDKVRVKVVALGGEHGLGRELGRMVRLVAGDGEAHTLPGCGHFVPEERPAETVQYILAMAAGTDSKGANR